jgi:hypothetical protein
VDREQLLHVSEGEPAVLAGLLDVVQRMPLLAQPRDDPGVGRGRARPAAAVVGDHPGVAPAPQRARGDPGLARGFGQRYLSRSLHGRPSY